MPVSVEQLRQKRLDNPKQFEKDQKDLKKLSILLFPIAQKLNVADDKEDRKLGKQLGKYVEAINTLSKDPSIKNNRDEIDSALDTLAGFGDFLGAPAANGLADGNVAEHITLDKSVEDAEAIKNGVHTLNRFCEFNMRVTRIMDGKVTVPTDEERKEQKEKLREWRERREREREETLAREARIDEEAKRARQEREQREAREKQAQKKAEEDAFKRAMYAAKKEEERLAQAREEERRRQEEARKSAEQREREAREAAEREKARQVELQANMRRDIEGALADARRPNATAHEKKVNMATAVAYHRELSDLSADGSEAVDTQFVNRNMQTVFNSAEFAIAEREGRLDELASLSAEELNKRVLDREREVGRYAEVTRDSVSRANTIYRQLDRTWRVRSDSAEYRAMKSAVQSVAQTNEPAGQLGHYLASEPAKQYVAKNLNEANSAVGKTRMACTLAFLKQTMPKKDFKSYCDGLNALRGIKSEITDNALSYDKTNPRCFVPEEIGTVKEVYEATRERFHTYAMENKTPPARDIALLTALKSMASKSADGENLVVEHEALQAEIEKVQKDRRFVNAIQSKSPFELIERAWGGNFDSLNDYDKPLSEQAQQRVEQERQRQEQEKARIEQERLEQERAIQAEKERLEQEKLRQEQERLRQEQEKQRLEQEKAEREAREAELRKQQKPLSACYTALNDDVQRLGSPLTPLLNDMDSPEDLEKDVETFATLIALWDYKKKSPEGVEDPMVNTAELRDKVQTLKQEPFVRQLTKSFKSDEDFSKVVQFYNKKGEKTKYSPEDKKIYAAVNLSARMNKAYADYQASKENPEGKVEKKPEWKKAAAKFTVADGYQILAPQIDGILQGGVTYKDAAELAAKTIALREQEVAGGANAPVDGKLLQKRVAELSKDRSVNAIGQSLSGPTFRDQVKEAIAGKPDKAQAFAELLGSDYQRRVENAQRQKDAQKVPNEPQPQGPEPT